MTPRLMKIIATVAVAAVLAIGAAALAGAGSGSQTANTAAGVAGGGSPPAGAGGRPPGGAGQPGFGGAGFGTQVSGAAARKAEQAALARVAGQVERVMRLPDGSYVVHVITSGGEVHVAVSRDLGTVRTLRGPPAGPPPAGSATPSGVSPSGIAGTTTS